MYGIGAWKITTNASTMELAKCKYSDCVGTISIKHVRKVSAIPKAPHHLALVAECPECARAGQYVVERESWDVASAEKPAPRVVDTRLEAGLLDLEVVEGVDDLVALWASYPTPPPRDGLEGKCLCADCVKRRYG